MSIHVAVRPVDRKRAVQIATAHLCNDKAALVAVLDEAEADRYGLLGLVMALLDYVEWVTRNTGPLTEPGPGEQDQA